MRKIAFVVPSLTLLLAGLVSVMPWGVPGALRFFLPALPLAVVHCWARSWPGSLPLPVAFFAGLAVDMLTFGPLGYWALLYVLAVALAGLLRDDDHPAEGLLRWLHFGLVLLPLLLVAWLIGTFYFWRPLDARPLLIAGALLLAIYPVVALVLAPLGRLAYGPRLPNLERMAASRLAGPIPESRR